MAGACIVVGAVHCNGVIGEHCGGSPSVPTGRPQGVCAASTSLYSDPDGGPGCTTLADCPSSIGYKACLQGRCSVDLCLSDGDCPNGQACGCADLYYGGNAMHANACLASQCRVDGDCGAGRFCSASIGPGCGSLDGYYCHSTSDECQTHSDCCSDRPLCRYQPTLGHWACEASFACNG